MKTTISRFIMLILWVSTFGLSIYITASRHVIPESELMNYFLALLVIGILTVGFSYIHLKFLSPISTVRENMDEIIENHEEELMEE